MPKPHYTIGDITLLTKGTFIQSVNPDETIVSLLIDSRRLMSPAGCLFFALTSKRNDGHKYIEELYDKGVRNFIVSRQPDNQLLLPEANLILVTDVLVAIQVLAAAHRKQFSIPVIGITGSNGKTIVKEWLYQLLFEDLDIVRNPKSFNSQIGVPLSVWQMSEGNQLGIFEAGISEPDEMVQLQKIIQPTIGIFTNVGHAHDENFIQRSQKVGEKLNLFKKVEVIIYCLDHKELQEGIVRSHLLEKIKSFTWSRKVEANLRIMKVIQNEKHTEITGYLNGEELSIAIPFIDEASIENAVHCWATLLYLGYQNELIAKRMEQLHPVAMRMEMKAGINNCTLINDSYSSDIDSLAIALDFLNQQKQHKKKTVILSDILQSGRSDAHLYAQIGLLLKSKQVDRFIGIGKALMRQSACFDLEKVFYPDTETFLSNFMASSFSNESILIKGARVFEFERIGEALQQKSHETILEIDLGALVENFNYYRSLLKPRVKMMLMVKAFSYGSGSFEIANALQFHHADYLTVAYSDEGVELRKAGINLPIMVMNPDEQGFDSMIKFDLEPEIFSFHILNLLEVALRKFQGIPKPMGIHLKLDTGMHRLGYSPEELTILIDTIKRIPGIRVKSVFSHLAASDNPEHDDFTRAQIELFDQLSQKICREFDYPILRHILNSAGISRFPEAQFDMVRLGIGLYGIASDEQEQQFLQNVSTLKTSISQVKKVHESETIGYNRMWNVDHETTIAIVPIGYADGLSRSLSNGVGHVWINGQIVPIIGSVCMDMTMIDITGIEAVEGEEVIIFGKERSINELALEMHSIPYEILTGISQRVRRIYFEE